MEIRAFITSDPPDFMCMRYLTRFLYCKFNLFLPLSGRLGWYQDPAEEVDHLPESPAGVLPSRAPCLLQQPEGSVHAAGAGLEGHHLLWYLPRSMVSGNAPLSPTRLINTSSESLKHVLLSCRGHTQTLAFNHNRGSVDMMALITGPGCVFIV